MDIAEQVIRAKQDLDDVYSAGQSSMVDESKLIPKTVSGSYISVDDVSEIPHSVGCKVESVNLCPEEVKSGRYYDAAPSASGADAGYIRILPFAVKPLTTYTFSSNLFAYSIWCCGADGGIERIGWANSYVRTITTPENCTELRISLINRSGAADTTAFEYAMLNKGTTALPYTPYVKPEEVKVMRCGKNLCGGEAFAEKIANSIPESKIDRENKTVTLRDAVASAFLWWDKFEPNTRYTVFLKGKNSTTTYYNVTNITCHFTDGTYENLSIFDGNNSQVCWTSPAGKTISRIKGGYHAATAIFEYDYVGLFKGTLALEDFEPYNGQTLTPATDGTVEGMTSVSPYMNIFSDTEGVNIEATYNKSYGMQTEWDRFWDAFQEYGKRVNYYQAFGFGDSASHSPWTNQNFKPKYPIKPRYVNNMFTNFGYRGDVTEAAEIDFSNAWAVYNIFVNCPWITRVGVINCTGMEEGGGALLNACTALETVDKFIFKSDGTQKMSSLTFTGCTSLKNIAFEGKANFDINFKDSPLSKASITSVINTLYEGSTGKTLTLKLSAVNTAFETSSGAADGSTSAEFAALVATKTNWTITMI